MAGPKQWTEELIAARIEEGRGTGTRENYSPWLKVQEFSSRGTQTRIPGLKLKRTIHTFSYLERALFLYREFHPRFWDYNEQRAMDRSVTLGFASKLRIRHPRYPKTRIPVVMTLDAVSTEMDEDGVLHLAAWDVKPRRQLHKPRVQAKLSLHKAFCAHVGMPHYLFTETSLPRNVVRNIDYVRMSQPRDGELELVPGLFTWHPDQFEEDLWKCRTRPSVSHFCAQYDRAHRLERGTGLRIFKLLVWQHRIKLNLDVKWLEREPIPRRNERVQPLHLVREAA